MANQNHFSPAYRKYALGILLVGYIVNFVDRTILSILLEPIKLELTLTDTQLGFLGGLAFAVFYTFLGIPIAMLADRKSRVKILAIAMVVWSLMTALCGRATDFMSLLLARIGVGAGEAGASPPSHSLISDYFPVEARATALSIYALGIPIGSMIGNFVGGWGAEALGWRNTFYLVGLPGVLVALVIWFTLREPPRGMSDGIVIDNSKSSGAGVNSGPAAPGVSEVLSLLWSKRSFRHLSFAAGLHAFVGYGAGTWNAPFFIRIHEMPISEVGSWLALVSGIGAIGTFLGGYWADKLADRTGEKTLVFLGSRYRHFRHGALSISSLLVWWHRRGARKPNARYGSREHVSRTIFRYDQALVSLRMRAVASAILLFVLNLIGMGLGPYLVGVASDLLAPTFGQESIRYALCLAVLANVWAAGHYFLGARHMRKDLADTEAINTQMATPGNAA